MKKPLLDIFLLSFLATVAYAERITLRLNFGGTYFLDGDYNLAMDGMRNYEHMVLGPTENFIDNLKKFGLGYQIGGQLLIPVSTKFAIGIEINYLNTSVVSGFERDWHSYNWTLSPTLSSIPMLLSVNYITPLGGKIDLHLSAGGGAFFSSLNYTYDIEDSVHPYSGTWTPDSKTVLGARAGIGLEFELSKKFALTFDISGQFAEIAGFSGSWEGIYSGIRKSGTGILYRYDYDGQYPMIGIYDIPPVGTHFQNVQKAKFSLSGISSQIGIKIPL